MHFRRLTTTLALLAVLVPMGARLHAQEKLKPVGIVSIAPLDELLPNIKYLMQSSGQAAVGGMVKLYGTQYSEGLDGSRPWGAVVTMNGQEPTAVAFLPLKDKDALFENIGFLGVEPDDLGDDTYEFFFGQSVFAKQVGDWMYVAQTEAALEGLPANPVALLGNLKGRYDIGIRLNLQALPAELRDFALAQLRSGFESSMNAQSSGSEEERAAQRAAGEAQIAQLEKLITETEQAVVGWKIDETAGQTYIEIAQQYVEGTSLAMSAEGLKDLSSKFGSLMLPGSSINARFTSKITTEEEKTITKMNLQNSFDQVKGQIEAGDMPPKAQEFLGNAVEALSKVLNASIDEGVFDGGMSISVAGNQPKMVIGTHVASGEQLAKEVQALAADIPDSPQAPKFSFNTGEYKGFTMHNAFVPLKIADPEAKAIYGDGLLFNIAISEKTAIITYEKEGDAEVKAAIDRFNGASAKTVVPFQVTVEMTKLLTFAQSMEPNPMLDIVLQALGEYSEKDDVKINLQGITRGSVMRLTIEEGVLQAAGAAGTAGQGQQGGF